MKKITLSLVITYTLLLFGCASDNLIGEQKPQEKLNTKPATTIVQLEGASSNVAEKGEQTATSRATRAFAPATTSNGITQSNGFIKFINPTDANTQSIKIDVNGSNFRTWLFLSCPVKQVVGWALMDWDDVKLSADQQKIELSANPKELTVTWFGGKTATIEPTDVWYISAVMGGGQLQESTKELTSLKNGYVADNKAFELNFRGLPTVTEQGAVQAPLATTWTKLEVKKQDKFSLNLSYELKGRLLRAKIQEDNNEVNAAKTSYDASYDFDTNSGVLKFYHFRSTLFYQPNLYLSYGSADGTPITIAIPRAEGQADAGMTQKFIPNHSSDLASSEEKAQGNHGFMVWVMPTIVPNQPLLGGAVAESEYYTIITSSIGGCAIGSKKNNYVGEFISQSRATEQGGIFSLGQLKEINPRVTKEMLGEGTSETDSRIMEHPIPLEALAENNLGFEAKTFANDPYVVKNQPVWSRDKLFERRSSENDVNYANSLIRDFPDGYRCPTIWDYTFAFPYPASNGGWATEPSVQELGESIDFSFSALMDDSKRRGKNIPEYLHTAYDFKLSESQTTSTSLLTWNRYYGESREFEGAPDKHKYKIQAVRFAPSLYNIDDPEALANPFQARGVNHKCAYFYDFDSYFRQLTRSEIDNNATSYVIVRARYIGNALVTDEMVQSDAFWSTPFKGEVVRYFPSVGPANKFTGRSDKESKRVKWEDWGANDVIDLWTMQYMSATQYNRPEPSMQKEMAVDKISRRGSSGNYTFPVRPVKTFKRL